MRIYKVQCFKNHLWLVGLMLVIGMVLIALGQARSTTASSSHSHESVGVLGIDIQKGTYRASASGKVRYWQYVLRSDASCNGSVFSQPQSGNLTTMVWSKAFRFTTQNNIDNYEGQYICFRAVAYNGKHHYIGRQLSLGNHFASRRLTRAIGKDGYEVVNNSGLELNWFSYSNKAGPFCNLTSYEDEAYTQRSKRWIMPVNFSWQFKNYHGHFLCFLGRSTTTDDLVEVVTKMNWRMSSAHYEEEPLAIVAVMRPDSPALYTAVDIDNRVKSWSHVVAYDQQSCAGTFKGGTKGGTPIVESNIYVNNNDFAYNFICFRADLRAGGQVYVYTQIKPYSYYSSQPGNSW